MYRKGRFVFAKMKTNFKIQGTYFLLPENSFETCPKNADKNDGTIANHVCLNGKRKKRSADSRVNIKYTHR